MIDGYEIAPALLISGCYFTFLDVTDNFATAVEFRMIMTRRAAQPATEMKIAMESRRQ
jgi:hypothetical protein